MCPVPVMTWRSDDFFFWGGGGGGGGGGDRPRWIEILLREKEYVELSAAQ